MVIIPSRRCDKYSGLVKKQPKVQKIPLQVNYLVGCGPQLNIMITLMLLNKWEIYFTFTSCVIRGIVTINVIKKKMTLL